MAALRSSAARILAATSAVTALVATSLLLFGCAEDRAALTTSQVPGVELVRLPFGPGAAAWSPDGRQIATAGRGGLALRNARGKAVGRVDAPPLGGYLGPAARIAWSPRGDRLFYLTTQGQPGKGSLEATEVGADGGPARQTPIDTYLAYGAWSPRGWPLLYLTGRFDVGLDGGREGPAPALWTLPHDGARPRRLARLRGFPEAPAVSPDGRRIAYVEHLHHRAGLWVRNADGSEPRRLDRAVLVPQLAWSPDGRWIAYSALRRWGDRLRLYLAPAAGGTTREVGSEEVLDGPTWSPDGRWLAFSTPAGAIRRTHPDGSGAETVAELPGEEVRGLLWSPNGRRLAYTAYRPQTSD